MRITLSWHSVYPSVNDGSLLTVSTYSLHSTNVTSAINTFIFLVDMTVGCVRLLFYKCYLYRLYLRKEDHVPASGSCTTRRRQSPCHKRWPHLKKLQYIRISWTLRQCTMELSLNHTCPDRDERESWPFLDILPLEVREMVYRYVLMVKVENNMNSHEVRVFPPIFAVLADSTYSQYNYHRNRYDIFADHTYRFHMSVLSLNHQIQLEARETFERECLFVSVITAENSIYSRLNEYGLLVLCQYSRFPRTAMTLSISAANEVDKWSAEGESLENGILSNHIIACEDMPTFYTSVLRIRHCHPEGTNGETLHIRVDPSLQGDGSPHPGSKLWRLLDPLRQLHGIGQVDICGLESQSFRTYIINSMSAPPDTVTATMAKTILAFEQGDKARGFGDLPLAVVKYNTGLNIVPFEDSHYEDGDDDSHYDDGDDTMDHGPDAGQPMKRYEPLPPCHYGSRTLYPNHRLNMLGPQAFYLC